MTLCFCFHGATLVEAPRKKSRHKILCKCPEGKENQLGTSFPQFAQQSLLMTDREQSMQKKIKKNVSFWKQSGETTNCQAAALRIMTRKHRAPFLQTRNNKIHFCGFFALMNAPIITTATFNQHCRNGNLMKQTQQIKRNTIK